MGKGLHPGIVWKWGFQTYTATASSVRLLLGQKEREWGLPGRGMVFIHRPVVTSHSLRVSSSEPAERITEDEAARSPGSWGKRE